MHHSNTRLLAPLVTLLAIVAAGSGASALELKSPDGQLTLKFAVTDFEGLTNCPVYQVGWNGQPVISSSRLGLALAGTPLTQNFKVTKEVTSTHDSAGKLLENNDIILNLNDPCAIANTSWWIFTMNTVLRGIAAPIRT